MSPGCQIFTVMPWVGGVNTSVDPGVLNSQELVQADNVKFSSSGARIKREALEYLENGVPTPDFRSSSGTTRTLKWTTNALVNITSLNERLVVGEKITVTGVANYLASDAPILTRTSIPQVTTVACVADVGGNLAGKYFLLSAGDNGTDYYVWYQVSGVGTDPALAGRTGILVSISTGDANTAVATATQTILEAHVDFAATALSSTVTVTNALGGLTDDGANGNSGFTVSVTTKGGHSITYTGGSSLTESSTAAGVTVARASKVIAYHDYWRYVSGETKTQISVFATNNFQLFTLDDGGRRVQIHGQEQTSTVVCAAASTLTTGAHFLLNGAGNTTNYYVWYNKASGGGDPAVTGRTGIEVAVGSGDTNAQVATATQLAIDALAAFTATVDTATVTITAASSGVTNQTVDSNTGFTFATTAYGATAPTAAVSQICAGVMNERLIMALSGVGNYMIRYNPEENSKYQLLFNNINSSVIGPDASFFFFHQDRMWANDKAARDRLNYSETFDETKWYGFGDSGALPVFPGDNDPEGLTCGYAYKGFAVAGKKAKRYRILGDSPENYQVVSLAEGFGNEGPMTIPVDEADVVFISRRGIHSQQVTDAYGDTEPMYLSANIKPTFTSWEPEQLKYAQGAYIPELNSIAIAVAEDGESSQNALWLYNFEVAIPGRERKGAWYRWPDISCTALGRRFINGTYKLVMGTSDGRIIQAQKANSYSDFSSTGIDFIAKTGTIYPHNDPLSMKAFKKITMVYRPKGNFAFTVTAKIDNQPAQSFSFNDASGLALLGVDFILGSSILGVADTLAPFTLSMEGIGRGITLIVTQTTDEEQVEIWGYVLEYENADLMQAVDHGQSDAA